MDKLAMYIGKVVIFLTMGLLFIIGFMLAMTVSIGGLVWVSSQPNSGYWVASFAILAMMFLVISSHLEQREERRKGLRV